MITGLIAVLILVVVLPASASNGEWGTFWIFIGVAAFVLVLGSAFRTTNRAYGNFIDYWANGVRPEDKKGAAQPRSRQSTAAGFSIRPNEPSKREEREAAAKRAAFKARLASGEERLSGPGVSGENPNLPLRVCHYCGRAVRASGSRANTAYGSRIEYICPKCGNVNWTQLGA